MNMMSLISLIRKSLGKQNASSPEEVEKAELLCYVKALKPGMVVFDVGANVGRLTALFSTLVGANGRVHSFEPTGETYRRLCLMCEALGLENVRTNHSAVGDMIGKAQFHQYASDHAAWNSMACRPLEKYGIVVKAPVVTEVPVTTIDKYCEEASISRIDFLKIDVEGAELQVLRGASRMFSAKGIRSCLFEFGQTTFDMGNNPREIAEFFEDHQYRVRNIIPKDGLFPGGEGAQTAFFAIHIAEPA